MLTPARTESCYHLANLRSLERSRVDGASVAEVVEAAPDLLPKIHHALISGTYLPGDIRRAIASTLIRANEYGSGTRC